MFTHIFYIFLYIRWPPKTPAVAPVAPLHHERPRHRAPKSARVSAAASTRLWRPSLCATTSHPSTSRTPAWTERRSLLKPTRTSVMTTAPSRPPALMKWVRDVVLALLAWMEVYDAHSQTCIYSKHNLCFAVCTSGNFPSDMIFDMFRIGIYIRCSPIDIYCAEPKLMSYVADKLFDRFCPVGRYFKYVDEIGVQFYTCCPTGKNEYEGLSGAKSSVLLCSYVPAPVKLSLHPSIHLFICSFFWTCYSRNTLREFL